jgi:hypothetical protein
VLKRVCTILLACFASNNSDSQSLPEFAPIGATWDYSVENNAGPGVGSTHGLQHYVCEEALFLQGQACKRLSTGSHDYFVSQDSLRFYIFNEPQQTWRLMYDFGKNVNEFYYAWGPNSGDSIYSVISEKGTVSINGFVLPYVEIYTFQNGQTPFGGRAVYNMLGLMYMFPHIIGLNPFASELACYQDSVIGNFSTGLPCSDQPGEVDSITLQSRFYPNPSSGVLQFFVPLKAGDKIVLHDVLGRLVYYHQVNGYSITLGSIDLGFLPNGLYAVTVSNFGGSSRYTSRWVKQTH